MELQSQLITLFKKSNKITPDRSNQERKRIQVTERNGGMGRKGTTINFSNEKRSIIKDSKTSIK